MSPVLPSITLRNLNR